MEPNLKAEDIQRMKSALELDGIDENDPNYYHDNLRDNFDDAPDADKKKLKQRLMVQKQIDDKRIAIVYEALSNGIELKGNSLYYGMLETYPHF